MDARILRPGMVIVKINSKPCRNGMSFGDKCTIEGVKVINDGKIEAIAVNNNFLIRLDEKDIAEYVPIDEFVAIEHSLWYLFNKQTDEQAKNQIDRRRRGVMLKGHLATLNNLNYETIKYLYDIRTLVTKDEATQETKTIEYETFYQEAMDQFEAIMKKGSVLRQIDAALVSGDRKKFIELSKILKTNGELK